MQLSQYLAQRRGAAVEMAKALQVSSAFLGQIASGVRPAPPGRCVGIELASEGWVRRWDLRPDDWHSLWPELIGADGAPPVPVEARDAA